MGGTAHLRSGITVIVTFKSLFDASFYELSTPVSELIFVDIPGVVLPSRRSSRLARGADMDSPESFRNARGRWFLAFVTVPIAAAVVAVHALGDLSRYRNAPAPGSNRNLPCCSDHFVPRQSGGHSDSTRAGEVTRRGLTILLVVLGSYFLLCLRVSYFKEWKWDSDTDKLYSAVAYHGRACGLNDIPVNWRYDGSLNSTGRPRQANPSPSLSISTNIPRANEPTYSMRPTIAYHITNYGLTVVYRAPSGAAIALNPAIDCAPAPPQSK